MLIRTHLAFAILAILIFISHVNNQVIFAIMVLVATFLPDADSAYSTLGQKKFFSFLQIFVRHRGLLHSFTFAILTTLLFVLFIPILAFGFFLGYGLHLFIDSFTLEGIRPFYPSRTTTKWRLKTGGLFENGLFVGIVLADLFILSFVLNVF
ncbi:MAG: metal-dependent hydrolase [Nanoarchaeota archaeon]